MKTTSFSPLKLVAILPSANNKYDAPLQRRGTPLKTETTISSLTRFESTPDGGPLPQGWVKYLHPEGNTYYHSRDTNVVSDTDPRGNGVTALFNTAHKKIHDQLSHNLKAGGFEVYLSVSDSLTQVLEGVVEYYVVDYEHRSIFWVDDVNIMTDLAGSVGTVDRFESMEQLRLSLEPEFWTHVEYYPCHQATYDGKAERELTAVIRHGCVDDTTAPGSVFPYGADECSRYLKLLERFHRDDESTESYRRSWIARLWASICRSRYINRYGLPSPRVDRLQGLQSYLSQQMRASIFLAFGEALCLGMSRRTFARLTELWNGRIIYQRHWQPFLEQQRSEWRWTALGGLYLLMMNGIQSGSGTSFILIVSSASCTCSAIILSALMLQAHSPDRLRTASDISSYVSMTESLEHGLRPLSIAFTLPKALLGYGTLIFGGNAVHHLGSQLQNEPVQTLYMTTAAAAIPLFAALVVYRSYGPAAP